MSEDERLIEAVRALAAEWPEWPESEGTFGFALCRSAKAWWEGGGASLHGRTVSEMRRHGIAVVTAYPPDLATAIRLVRRDESPWPWLRGRRKQGRTP